MKYVTRLIVLSVLLLASVAYASDVKNVELSYDNGATVASIYVDGPIRFTHETVDAKNGKPFRVVVDVLAAEHKLSAKKFTSLPNCPITSIRTSQYSVTPEKVVRFVFDLKKEYAYQIDSKHNVVEIRWVDKSTSPFAKWSADAPAMTQPKPTTPIASKPADKPVEVATINKKIESDRQASLQTSSAKPKAEVQGPTMPKEEAKPTVKTPTVAKAQPKPASVKAQPKPSVEKKPMTAKVEPKPAVKKPTVAKTEPKVTPKVSEKPVTVAAKPKAEQPTKAKAKPQPSVKKPSKKAEPTPAKVEPKSDNNAKSTSRFRRNPTGPTKIKGTLVAEFPKRLVIKYNSHGRRDPFETLINETKSDNNPIERRVPNVEGLRLVGIIESTGGNSALFEDTDNYGYILKAGDKVQKGYVLRVETDRVYFQIFEYGWSRTVALNIED